ncbi:hypothetical protein NOCA2120027 [metagenome]|uniref:DUF541 domain-containing protein n=1 Tax=metagenome TaxID=256318 RepID=A0A2P2BW80_9ZZZZ
MSRTVTVTGSGSARAVPDSAVVRLAAVARAASVREAFSEVDSTVALLTETAQGLVEAHRIGSSDLSIWPTTDRDNRPDGFECSHALEIRCASLEGASALLAAVVETVGDRVRVDGVSLEVSDTSTAHTQAREAAYADALTRATELATLSGSGLGEVLSITEGGSHPGGPVAFAASAKADFQPGERSTSLALTVTFALTDQTP